MNKQLSELIEYIENKITSCEYSSFITFAEIELKSYNNILAKAKSLQEQDGWIQVKPVKDDSGHWYVVPNDLYNQFLIDSENEDMCDSGEFDEKYGEYRTVGDLNLVQLYLPNKPKQQ